MTAYLTDQDRRAHLQVLADTVTRLASAQAQTVTWALALTTATIAANTVTAGNGLPALAGVVTNLVLWFTHASYLAGERAWRETYAACLQDDDLRTSPAPLLGPRWARKGIPAAAASWSLTSSSRTSLRTLPAQPRTKPPRLPPWLTSPTSPRQPREHSSTPSGWENGPQTSPSPTPAAPTPSPPAAPGATTCP